MEVEFYLSFFLFPACVRTATNTNPLIREMFLHFPAPLPSYLPLVGERGRVRGQAVGMKRKLLRLY